MLLTVQQYSLKKTKRVILMLDCSIGILLFPLKELTLANTKPGYKQHVGVRASTMFLHI